MGGGLSSERVLRFPAGCATILLPYGRELEYVIADIHSWAAQFSQLLRGSFGERLRFVGYQGSYARGEATEASDIDVVAILDEVNTQDLDVYRRLVRTMPEGHLACGFLCGVKELEAWPKYDLYALWLDTKPILGSLEPLLPLLTRQDAWDALHIGAANLYHAACHSYLYQEDPRLALPELSKAAFFCLRFYVLLRDGKYLATRRELLDALDGPHRELLSLPKTGEAAAALSLEDLSRVYDSLLSWCQNLLQGGLDLFQ